MQTQSYLLNKIIAVLGVLNHWYEHSLLNRAVEAVKRAARTSLVLTGFLRDAYEQRDYWGGSWICRAVDAVTKGVLTVLVWCVRLFDRANASGANRRLLAWLQSDPAQRDETNEGFALKASWFVRKVITGCAPWRLVAWFFGDDAVQRGGESKMQTTSCTVNSVALHKVIYMAFVAGVLLVPGHLWTNAILLGSAALFAFIFAVAWVRGGASDVIGVARGASSGVDAAVYADKMRLFSPALLLFVGFCALSIFTGYGGGDSLRVFAIFFACVVHSVCVTLAVRNMVDLRLFAKFIAVALVLTALFGFYQLAVGIPIRPEFTDLLASPGLARLHSTMGNPNNDAQFWGMMLPFVLAMVVAARCDTKRLLLAGAVAVCVGAFALTYSRAGYVALMAGVGVFILMAAPRLVPIVLIAGIVALPFIPSGIIDRLLTLGTDTSSQYRFNIWRGVVNMLEVYWVQGIGMGPVAFAQTYARHYQGEAFRALHAHNTFLDVFIHSGIGALISFVAYLFSLIRRGVAAHMNSDNKEYKIFVAAGVGALVVFIAFGVGEYVWFYPRVMLVFWVVVGLLTALTRFNQTGGNANES
ncbi:MAG: O-antigen ligase family protein [Defluviitaleaceae bacterium]|nr:O-antigen ligase family protein [Defluviitaleaceae bacterium]